MPKAHRGKPMFSFWGDSWAFPAAMSMHSVPTVFILTMVRIG